MWEVYSEVNLEVNLVNSEVNLVNSSVEQVLNSVKQCTKQLKTQSNGRVNLRNSVNQPGTLKLGWFTHP